MKFYKLFLISIFFLSSGVFGQLNNFYIVKNPYNFSIEKVPVVIPVTSTNEKTNFGLYQKKDRKFLLTQQDIVDGGKNEIVGLIDLNPGENRIIEVRTIEKNQSPEIEGDIKVSYDENKRIYTFVNGFYKFSLSFRKDGRKDWEDIYHVICSDFVYLGNNIETGIKHISDPQLGVFKGQPEVLMRSGPLRLQLILKGKGELRSGTSRVSGNIHFCITLYSKKPTFDTETIFIPEEESTLYLVAAGETLIIASDKERWNLSSISHQTGKDISIIFGGPEKNSVEGTKWVTAICGDKGFSYVHDDMNSNVSASKGEGGIERSKVVFRLSNFSEKSNYIRPDFFGIRTKKGEPLTLRMRITFYPVVGEEKKFGSNDYMIFQTDFLLPRIVKNTFNFSGDVALSNKDVEKVQQIITSKDVFILAGDKVEDSSLGILKELSAKWHIPLLTAADISDFLNNQYYKNDCKDTAIILVGSPEENLVVRAHNKKYGFVDAYFPGNDKGIISVLENFLETGRPLIYVGGESPCAAKKALEYLRNHFKPPMIRDLQVRIMPPEMRPRPWMKREKINNVELMVCKGETQPLHLLLYSPGDIKNLEVMCDLKNSQKENIPYQVSYIPWSFAGVDKDGNIYPEGKQSTHFEGHPLPRATFLPGSVAKEGTDIPFITYIANHDAMWPGVPKMIPSGRMVSLWITLAIEKNVLPGFYEGAISIRWDRKEKKIPVKVEVVDITLPSHWKMDFFPMYSLDNYNENVFKLYLGIDKKDEETYLNAIKKLGHLLYSHGATVANVSPYDMKISFYPDGTIKVDPAELNQVINAYREGGFNGWFEMSVVPHYWEPMVEAISKFKNCSIEDARQIFFEKLKEWMRAMNIEGKMISRVSDEPGDADRWVEMASKLKNSGLLITVAHNQTKEEFVKKMIGTIDIWCPLWNRAITGWMGELLPDDEPSRFNRKFFHERKQKGEMIWNYTCATPYFSMTRLPTEIYFYFWDSYNKKFDGVVYYGGGYWCHMWGGDDLPGVKGHIAHRDYYVYNVYGRNKKFDWVAGTTMFYPDARIKEVISSQRFELVKQAQEDIKLFSLVRSNFGDEALDNLLSGCVSPRNHLDIPPEDFCRVREKVIKFLLDHKNKQEAQ